MKTQRFYFIFLILLLLFVSVGCRSRGVEPVVVNDGDESVDRSSGSIVVDNVGKRLPNVNDKANTLRAKSSASVDPGAVFFTEGDYSKIDYVDVNNWEKVGSDTFGFSVFIPSGFWLFEDVPGRFNINAEGVGDFYQIWVGGEDPGVGEFGEKLLTTHELTIKDRFFLVEEYDTSYGTRLISYFANFGDYWYRFNFLYDETQPDMLDMFRRSVETFEIVK